MCMLNTLAHQSAVQTINLRARKVDPRLDVSVGPKWYTGEDGLLHQSNGNRWLYSEDFTNAVWLQTASSVVAAGTQSPRGAPAFKLVEDTTNSSRLLYQQFTGFMAGRTYTASFDVKAAERVTCRVTMPSVPFGSTRGAYFDLSTQTVFGVSSGVLATAIVALGDDWYRVSVTMIATASGSGTPALWLVQGDATSSSATYLGDGTSGFYVAAAQLEVNTSFGDYFKTTSTPVFEWPLEYDPVLGKRRSIWPARTNLLSFSEQFSSWSPLQSTVSSDATAGPDGSNTADLLLLQTSGAFALVSSNNNISRTIGSVYVASAYLKAGPGCNYATLCVGTSRLYGVFNLASGTVLFAVANGTDFSGAVATITPAGNGFYRCTIAATAVTNTAQNVRIALSDGTNNPAPNVTGTPGVTGIYMWGAQAEVGAFAGPYIPTPSSATVTRQRDTIKGLDISKFRYNISEAVLYADVEFVNDVGGNVLAELNDGSSTERFGMSRNASLRATGYTRHSGGDAGDSAVGATVTLNSGASHRVAVIRWANNVQSVANGTLSPVDVTAGQPAPNQLWIGNGPFGGTEIVGYPRELRLYPSRNNDSMNQALTA